MLITNARTKLWTRQEFHRLYESGFFGPEDRVELIEGELVLMTPPGPQHTDPIKYGNKTLVRLYGETHDIAVQLPLDLGQINEPQPDFALIPVNTVPRGQIATTADLVIEVSYSSLAFDKKEKLALYAKSGIPEYWVLDTVNRKAEVYRKPEQRTDPSEGFGYADHQVFYPEQSIQPLRIPGLPCPLIDFFGATDATEATSAMD